MQDRATRIAILRLRDEGHGLRTISTSLGVSRNTVRRVLSSKSADAPRLKRPEKADGHEEEIRALLVKCQGNLVRVHEELAASGVVLAYTTLTAFCRRYGIGVAPKQRVGQYHFEPGQEMQHDTSPHDVVIGGKRRRMQCASLVFCYSRVVFARVYPTWNRFWVKVFLTEALIKMGGASGVCMLDNSSVIVARGNGKDAVMAPEMAAFGARFGFEFRAHRLGDANRSAHVERRFSYIENNFYAGRDFSDVEDLNRQLDAWCDKVNGTLRKDLGAKPIELFAAEKVALRRLPLHVPEVYLPHRRTVDTEGYINLHHNRYSAPTALIDHEVEVHETKDRVRILNGQRLVCEHIRDEDGAAKRRTLPEHARDATWKAKKRAPSPEETRLSASSTALAEMVAALKKRHGGRALRPLQRLHRMWVEYPLEPLNSALRVALDHGLLDLERVETLVLRHVAGDFFRIPRDPDDDEES